MLQGYYPYNEAWWWQHYIVGTGRLVKVEGKINAAMYEVIIDINLLQSTVVLGLEQRLIFQQAKKLKQKSKTRKQWLLDHSANVFEELIQSPDLNSTECLWRDLKIAVHNPPRPV